MYRPTEDDFLPCPSAHSDEPMRKPDHKAKNHGRPNHGKKWPGLPGPREREKIGGGYFVFKRGSTTGRIKTKHGGMPFEHPTFAQARQEAIRLQRRSGGRYDIFARVYTLDEQEAAALATTDLTED